MGAGSFNDKANEPANEKMPSQCVMVDLANQMERFKISRNPTNLLIRALFECYIKTYLEKLTRGPGGAFIRQSKLNPFFWRKTGHWSHFRPAEPGRVKQKQLSKFTRHTLYHNNGKFSSGF